MFLIGINYPEWSNSYELILTFLIKNITFFPVFCNEITWIRRSSRLRDGGAGRYATGEKACGTTNQGSTGFFYLQPGGIYKAV